MVLKQIDAVLAEGGKTVLFYVYGSEDDDIPGVFSLSLPIPILEANFERAAWERAAQRHVVSYSIDEDGGDQMAFFLAF